MDVTPFLEVTLKTEDGEIKGESGDADPEFCKVQVKEEPLETVTEFCEMQMKQESPYELSENGNANMEEVDDESSGDDSAHEKCDRPLLVLVHRIQEEEEKSYEKQHSLAGRGARGASHRERGVAVMCDVAPIDLSKKRRTQPRNLGEEEAQAGENKVEPTVEATEAQDLPGNRGGGGGGGGGGRGRRGGISSSDLVRSSKPKKHPCPQCNKGFATPSHLRTHMRTHTGTKPFCCPDCTASFSQSNNLRRHVRTHTQERPYKCSECDCAFRDSSHLHRHRLLHTGERPFRCGACGTAFAQSNTLRDHLRLHTGERPFVCALCPEAFVRRSHLNAHRQRAHATHAHAAHAS